MEGKTKGEIFLLAYIDQLEERIEKQKEMRRQINQSYYKRNKNKVKCPECDKHFVDRYMKKHLETETHKKNMEIKSNRD